MPAARRHGGERRALVSQGAAAPRQPGAAGVHPGRRHGPLRLHPGPLVRRFLQRGHQQVAVSTGRGRPVGRGGVPLTPALCMRSRCLPAIPSLRRPVGPPPAPASLARPPRHSAGGVTYPVRAGCRGGGGRGKERGVRGWGGPWFPREEVCGGAVWFPLPRAAVQRPSAPPVPARAPGGSGTAAGLQAPGARLPAPGGAARRARFTSASLGSQKPRAGTGSLRSGEKKQNKTNPVKLLTGS